MASAGTKQNLRHRTDQNLSSKDMDTDQLDDDEELIKGDNQYKLNGDNQQGSPYLLKEDNLQGGAISNMEVTIFGWKFNKVIAVTHINIFLYATCFWIQTGTLPVSF